MIQLNETSVRAFTSFIDAAVCEIIIKIIMEQTSSAKVTSQVTHEWFKTKLID